MQMVTIEHNKTASAAMVGLLLVIPASIVGYGFRWLALGLVLRLYAPESAGAPFAIILFQVVPNVIFGLLTGMVAVGLTHLLFRHAKLLTVAKVVSGGWFLIYAVGLGLGIALRGWSFDIVAAASIMFGLMLGSFVTAMDNSA